MAAIETAPPSGFPNADFHWAHEVSIWIERAGWPFPCIRYAEVETQNVRCVDPVVSKDILGRRRWPSVRLPLRPLWPGLAWNTLIFAAAWFFLGWSTLFAARRLRRLHRTHHNRCPACGYSLAGVTTNRCPECGHPAANPDLPRVSA